MLFRYSRNASMCCCCCTRLSIDISPSTPRSPRRGCCECNRHEQHVPLFESVYPTLHFKPKNQCKAQVKLKLTSELEFLLPLDLDSGCKLQAASLTTTTREFTDANHNKCERDSEMPPRGRESETTLGCVVFTSFTCAVVVVIRVSSVCSVVVAFNLACKFVLFFYFYHVCTVVVF